ncbi:MAG TPA: UDP-N-acetylmuramate dehydrogenase [Gemmatimonadales bacterium]|nr:UDP-N-acetylmuramate dehydrogenase [Gemmatimonadales bacterium]
MSARDPGFIGALSNEVQGEVLADAPLARYSTYRIGGPATVLQPRSPEDVATGIRLAGRHGVPWFALGLGSNVLLPDEGMDALVIRLGKGLDRLEQRDDWWSLGAGLPAPLAARRTAAVGWAGLQVMVGVPGTVGGGVFMNAGCHGGQWSDVVREVLVVDAGGEFRTIPGNQIPFSYRRSGLRGVLVLEATVQLSEADPEELQAEMNRLFEWRQNGTPFNQPCCGSVFTNPAGAPADGPQTAGQLLEAAGLKGRRIGGAEVSPMHANYFVNTGTATAADVRALISEAQAAVSTRFGVTLETEVKLIGTDGRYL